MDKRLAVQENEKKKRVARLLSRAAGHLARGNHRYAARALYQALDADPQNAEIRRQLSEVLLDACEDWMVGGALGWEWTEKRLRSVIEPLQPMLRSGQDVDTLKLLARIYERFRRLDDAMEALRKALAAGGSRDPEVHALLGRLHMQRGNLDRARYSFERSLSLQPRYVPGMVGLAALEMQKGEARAALLHLRGAVAADPRCTEAYCRLGELYLYRFGNVKRASLMARQALLLDPHDPMARHLLGMVRYVSGDVEGAVAEWQKTVSGLNAYGPSLHTLADVSLEKEDYGGARGYLERLLFAYPEDPEAKVKLGLASAALGDYFGASRLWEEARRQSQDDGYSRVFLADLYASLDRWDETWELLGEALSLELPPELDEQLRDLLLEAYAHCTLYEQAAYTVDKALQRYPDDPAILLAAALLHTGGKNFTLAWECAERARRLRPSDPGAYRVLGVWHMERGELDEAQQVLEKGYALDRNDPRTACDLGELSARRGDWEAAISWWEEARRLDPEELGYLRRLAVACQHTGRLERARSLWEQYLGLVPEDMQAQLAYGHVCLRQGDLLTCSGACESVLSRDRGHPVAMALKGAVEVKGGRLREGLRCFKEAWKRERELFLSAWSALGIGEPALRSQLLLVLRRSRYDPAFKGDMIELLLDELASESRTATGKEGR